MPVVGTIALNESNPMQILVTWDMDTIPTDTVIVGPQDTRGSVDFIVDPTTFNPSAIKQNGKRVLLLKDIGSCLLYTSPSPRDKSSSRMPSSA